MNLFLARCPSLNILFFKYIFFIALVIAGKSESPTGTEPMTSQIPDRRFNHWTTRDSFWAWPFTKKDKDEMFICRELGTKKKYESATVIKRIASQLPVGRTNL